MASREGSRVRPERARCRRMRATADSVRRPGGHRTIARPMLPPTLAPPELAAGLGAFALMPNLRRGRVPRPGKPYAA